MSKYNTLLAKMPANVPVGKSKVLGKTVEIGTALEAKVAAVRGDDTQSVKGRAMQMAAYLKSVAGPALLRSRRQFDHHEQQLQKQRNDLRRKVIGDHDPLDAERRAVLRSMTGPERIQAVLRDQEMRQAALRGGAALASVPDDVMQRAYEVAMSEVAPDTAAAIATAAEAQEIHGATLRMLQNEMLALHAIPTENGQARKFEHVEEFEKMLATLPKPYPVVVAQERVEADEI